LSWASGEAATTRHAAERADDVDASASKAEGGRWCGVSGAKSAGGPGEARIDVGAETVDAAESAPSEG